MVTLYQQGICIMAIYSSYSCVMRVAIEMIDANNQGYATVAEAIDVYVYS